MEIEKPVWAGHKIQCDKCITRFTLDAGDEDKVKPGFWDMLSYQFDVHCPKCNSFILIRIPKDK